MIIAGEDGVTHINVYSKGKTSLGRWLSNFAHSPIYIPQHGAFNSIEGYWYWLGSRDDRLRYLHGYRAKSLGQSIPCIDPPPLTLSEFRSCIKAAIDIKLKTYRVRLDELAESTLPLCHYYVYGSNRIDAGFEWIIHHIDNCRKCEQQGQNVFDYR